MKCVCAQGFVSYKNTFTLYLLQHILVDKPHISNIAEKSKNNYL